MGDTPIRDEALVLAAATADVSPRRIPELVGVVQADLRLRIEEYRSRYECAYETSEAIVFFVEGGHWTTIAERLGFDAADSAAVECAHTEHLRRLGWEVDRRREFASALEVRDCVVIGKDRSQAATDGGDTVPE